MKNKSNVTNQNIIHYWLDYLECFGTFKDLDRLKWVDFDNSNFSIINWLVLVKTEVRFYEYKIMFLKDWIPIYAWYKWMQLLQWFSKDYFVVYGMAFKKLSIEQILVFISENIIFTSFKRFDVCMDCKLSIKSVYKQFNELKQKWSKFYGWKWKLQTYYIWEKDKKKNRSYLIRVYDKLADIYKKGKQLDYLDYLKKKHVTRFEIEFREDLVSQTTLDDLKDDKYYMNLFLTYFEKHTNLFVKLGYQKLKLKYKKRCFDLQLNNLDDLLTQVYMNTFKWYANKILKFGWCPVDYLIRLWIIQKNTLNKLQVDMDKYIFGWK